MKTKGVVLGLFAIAIAVVSAFALQAPPRSAHVSVRFVGNNYFECVDTGLTCADFGPTICRVDVHTLSGIVSTNAKKQIFCNMTMNETSFQSIGLYASGSIAEVQ